jgi:hypothetical protein
VPCNSKRDSACSSQHNVADPYRLSSQQSASGEAGSGVLALARMISGVIYACLRAAPQRRHLSIFRQVVHATCELMLDVQTSLHQSFLFALFRHFIRCRGKRAGGSSSVCVRSNDSGFFAVVFAMCSQCVSLSRGVVVNIASDC